MQQGIDKKLRGNESACLKAMQRTKGWSAEDVILTCLFSERLNAGNCKEQRRALGHRRLPAFIVFHGETAGAVTFHKYSGPFRFFRGKQVKLLRAEAIYLKILPVF